MTGWKRKHWRLGSILLLLVLALAPSGTWLISRAWGNAGMVVLAQTLVTRPEATASGQNASPATARAEHVLQRAATYAPGNHSAWRGLGFALMAQGREDEAFAAWQRAEGMAEEFFHNGEQARRVKRYEEALVQYERAAVLVPDWGAPWYYMGLAYEELGAWEDALESFQQAEKRVGSIEEIAGSLYYHLARLLEAHAEPPDLSSALRFYEAALDSENFAQSWEPINIHYNRGDILRRQGRMREAKEEFKWVVNAKPDHYGGHVWFGAMIWQVDGDVNQAERYLKQAITLRPEGKWAYWWLGQIYQQVGRTAEAADAYRQVLEIDPTDEAALEFLSKWGSGSDQSRFK